MRACASLVTGSRQYLPGPGPGRGPVPSSQPLFSRHTRPQSLPWFQRQHRRPLAVLAAASDVIQEVSARELEDAVQSRAKPLIIDFYATWCGPCVLQSKELVKVAERLGDSVRILKIDTDENPDISNQLQIMGLPTVIIVPTDTSKPALRTEGLLSADKIVSLVTSEKGPAAVTTFDAGAKGLY
ncbi:TRXZ1 [Auxenochlorella protothecoides x Auxenochlorella symbiontica]